MNRVVPASDLDSEVGAFTDTHSRPQRATIRMGKAAFYEQIERPFAAGYELTAETMACNMPLDDAAHLHPLRVLPPVSYLSSSTN